MPSGQIKTSQAKERVGQQFGRLTVIEHIGSSIHRNAKYLCRCDCDAMCEKTWPFGKAPSCGCWTKEIQAQTNTKHGHSTRSKGTSKAYMVWQAMKARCQNPKNKDYMEYGGRGITVCTAWQNFEGFLADMGEPPENMTIDRQDTNGHYTKDNCLWVPQQVNCQNKRNNVLNPEMVRLIRTKHAMGISIQAIADDLGLKYMPVYHVIKGKTWNNIT